MGAILLTGSGGNLGPYVHSALARQHPDSPIVRIVRTHRPEDSDAIVGDLRNPQVIRQALSEREVTSVIHLAGTPYSHSAIETSPFDIIENDLSLLLCVLAESSAVERFIYASSALVYESASSDVLTEAFTDTLPPPRSPYGIAKWAGEQAVRAYERQHGVATTIWRPFNIVSPREPHDTPGGHVFVDLYRRIFVERQTTLSLFGNAQQMRSFLWVEDAADAFSRFLTDPRTVGATINMGGSETISLTELVAMMVDIGKCENILPSAYAPIIKSGAVFTGVDSPRRVPDLTRIESLGWRARTPLRETFTRFIMQKYAQ